MEFINYSLAAIIAYSGLLLGIILIKLAPEEQNPGKKYFVLFKKTIFFLILFFFLVFYNFNVLLSAVLLIFASILMLNKKIMLEKNGLVYLFLGILFYFSSKIFNLFVLESVLIFLYGIPTASLSFKLKKKNYYDIIVKNLWIFVAVILPYFVFKYY